LFIFKDFVVRNFNLEWIYLSPCRITLNDGSLGRINLHDDSLALKVTVLHFLDLYVEILENEVEAKILVVH